MTKDTEHVCISTEGLSCHVHVLLAVNVMLQFALCYVSKYD